LFCCLECGAKIVRGEWERRCGEWLFDNPLCGWWSALAIDLARSFRYCFGPRSEFFLSSEEALDVFNDRGKDDLLTPILFFLTGRLYTFLRAMGVDSLIFA
jgi:hypothetical protein